MSNSNAQALGILRSHIHKRFQNQMYPEPWRNLPEIPDKSEIMPATPKGPGDGEEDWDDYQKELVYNTSLPSNIINGSWPSKAAYIGAHYQLLREDAIASLRSSVAMVKADPEMDDNETTGLYTFVHFKGFLLGALGPAFRIEFSTERTGKQIRWEQSSRLQQGTLVALSPHRDMFRTICKIAVVAARPIVGGLDQNPPQIDLFWGNPSEAVYDPAEPYIMVEARSGYFESSRHVLVAMQKLMTERFILAKHLANLDPQVGPPSYLEEQPLMNLSSLVREEPTEDQHSAHSQESEDDTSLHNVNVLENFPEIPHSGLDASQMAALERMLTKCVAIIQGPPGTGKTFVSISTLRSMLENLSPEDPPIIIAAQTNHAIDQLLNHAAEFEPNFLRLGGRCDNGNEEILKRTLYELRKRTKDMPAGRAYRSLKSEYAALENHVKEIQTSFAPLLTEPLLLSETLLKHGIITECQYNSLHEDGWVCADTPENLASGPIATWLGPDQLVPIPRAPPVNLGLEMEESDLEFEQQQDLELEAADLPEDRDKEALSGTWLPFGRLFTGSHCTGKSEKRVKKLLKHEKNLYQIPIPFRGEVYRYFERQLNCLMLTQLHKHLAAYKEAQENIQVTKWLLNTKLIRHLGIKLIGCTTTGLSKYRGLLAALQPRTLLIEEAAETLEGTIIAAMFDSLEHLILVGDHKQLQAHCNVAALEHQPYNLSVSMFERLLNNSIGYTMLNKQRRMIPDIRKLLCIEPHPFYRNLEDHSSVLDRKKARIPIPGMGGRDTYFFHHTWPESRNADSSRYNTYEAEMITGFFNYLVLNGVEPAKITVLTLYNGQRKTMLRELKNHPSLAPISYFNVFTVDSYQGEENDVILLSLVRSNDYLRIGFLENKNRLAVALSRARRGLYLFGNAVTLASGETKEDFKGREAIWTPLLKDLRDQKRFDMDGGFPITCSNHGTTVSVFDADDWETITGGCDEKCLGQLPCGHQCPHKCHPFDHDRIICHIPCKSILSCGHECRKFCGQACSCLECDLGEQDEIDARSLDDEDWESNSTPSRGNRSPEKPGKNCLVGDQRSRSPMKSSELLWKDFRNRFDVGGKASASTRPTTPPKYRAQSSFAASHRMDLKQNMIHSSKRWNAWDAEKSDRELAERRRELELELSREDLSIIDIHQPVTVQDGVRVRDGAVRRVIHRGPTTSSDSQPLLRSSKAIPKPAIENESSEISNHTTLLLEEDMSNLAVCDAANAVVGRGEGVSTVPTQGYLTQSLLNDLLELEDVFFDNSRAEPASVAFDENLIDLN